MMFIIWFTYDITILNVHFYDYPFPTESLYPIACANFRTNDKSYQIDMISLT